MSSTVEPDTPSVSIIVVSYNTNDLTLACLRSIYDQAKSDAFEVLVVDNASQDDSYDNIRTDFPAVLIERSETNLGFAAANNRAARNAAGRYLLLMNPDTVVLDHAVDRLVAFAAAHPAAGIWGGRTVHADGSLNPTSCFRQMTLWSMFTRAIGLGALFPHSDLFNRETYGGWQRDKVREVGFVTGCFLLIERGLWARLGGFDERYFMYSEEADLCLRARRLGAHPLFTPSATIIHYGGRSQAVVADRIKKQFTGRMTYAARHWTPPLRLLAALILKMHALVRMSAHRIRAGASGSGQVEALTWKEVWRARREWARGY